MTLRIKEVMSEKGITQAELAERLNKSLITVKKTLAGNPTLETLERMAEAIGVPLWQFFISPNQINEKDANDNFFALIHHDGKDYHATSISELEKLIGDWKSGVVEK